MLTVEQKKIVEENIKMCYDFAHKYVLSNRNIYKFGLEYDDVVSIAYYAMCKCVLRFDASKGNALSTLFYVCALNDIRMFIRKECTMKRKALNDSVSYDVALDEDGSTLAYFIGDDMHTPEFELDAKEQTKDLRDAISTLDENIRNTVIKYYSGMKQHDIAEEIGISQPHVCKRLKTAHKLLKNRLSELGYTG